MARNSAIAAVSRAILGLIEDHCPAELLRAPDFQIYQPLDFEKPMAEGFSLFLYRVSINGSVRNLRPRRDPDGRRYRPSLPVDLSYLLTPWAADGERQQRLLGWSMRFLEDLGTLPAGLLNHYVQETDIFADNESLDLVCDPLPMQDFFNLWDKMKHHLQTSMTYTVRMVLLDSTVEIAEGDLVQTRAFTAAQEVGS